MRERLFDHTPILIGRCIDRTRDPIGTRREFQRQVLYRHVGQGLVIAVRIKGRQEYRQPGGSRSWQRVDEKRVHSMNRLVIRSPAPTAVLSESAALTVVAIHRSPFIE